MSRQPDGTYVPCTLLHRELPRCDAAADFAFFPPSHLGDGEELNPLQGDHLLCTAPKETLSFLGWDPSLLLPLLPWLCSLQQCHAQLCWVGQQLAGMAAMQCCCRAPLLSFTPFWAEQNICAVTSSFLCGALGLIKTFQGG